MTARVTGLSITALALKGARETVAIDAARRAERNIFILKLIAKTDYKITTFLPPLKIFCLKTVFITICP